MKDKLNKKRNGKKKSDNKLLIEIVYLIFLYLSCILVGVSIRYSVVLVFFIMVAERFKAGCIHGK